MRRACDISPESVHAPLRNLGAHCCRSRCSLAPVWGCFSLLRTGGGLLSHLPRRRALGCCPPHQRPNAKGPRRRRRCGSVAAWQPSAAAGAPLMTGWPCSSAVLWSEMSPVEIGPSEWPPGRCTQTPIEALLLACHSPSSSPTLFHSFEPNFHSFPSGRETHDHSSSPPHPQRAQASHRSPTLPLPATYAP